MVSLIIATMGIAGALSFCLAAGSQTLIQGLIFGIIAVATPVIASDLITEKLYWDDPLLTPRRISIVSFVWCLTGGFILSIFGIISGFSGRPDVLLRGILLIVCSSVGIRTLIFAIFSTRGVIGTAIAIGLQPLLMAIGVFVMLPQVWWVPLTIVIVVLTLVLLGPMILLVRISSWNFGPIRIIPLFRGFVYAWAEQHSKPLEEQLATIGETVRLEVNKLSFSNSGVCLGNLVAPYIHPGPFRNVGSSCLCTVITEGLNCETLVMHGISGHEKDMARSEDMVRIVSALNTPSKLPESKTCTPMVRAEVSGAKASCQIFGSAALFTLTLSPKSHDDLPDKIKDLVSEAAAKQGLAAIVVDAHNCLNDKGFLTEDDEKNLIMAAEEAMIKAHKSQMGPFKMGLSRVKPPEWGPDEGMGPCGIGALVVETDVGKNTYLIFDSNNMIQGFREDILGIVYSLGFVEAEVTTSDTHIVNAIGATDRGYNLAGEVMAHGKVLQYVEEVLNEVKLKPSEVSFTRVAIDDVKIIGVKGIEMLRSVVKTSFRVFIMTTITVLPISFLAAALVALLI